MDKISIQTLVPNATVADKKGTLDISSLMNITKPTPEAFSSEQLLKIKNKKREKLADVYNSYYDKCIEKIKILNNTDKTDLVFSVPYIVPECQNYNCIDCLDFIETKLRFHKFDTLKMDIKTLFITWKYMELNFSFY